MSGTHWAAVEEGAKRTGRTPHRRDWRMVREVFVADTDAEAMRLSIGGSMGRMMREYFLPLLGPVRLPGLPEARSFGAGFGCYAGVLRAAQLAVGSPATVAEKLERVYHEVDGFGTLLVFGFDYCDNPQAWHNSLRLLAQEVAPRVKHLTPQ